MMRKLDAELYNIVGQYDDDWNQKTGKEIIKGKKLSYMYEIGNNGRLFLHSHR